MKNNLNFQKTIIKRTLYPYCLKPCAKKYHPKYQYNFANYLFDKKIKKAKTFWQKFSGFMFRKNADFGLLFENTRYLHTFFMRFDLDIFFLSKNGEIIAIKKKVKPFRIIFPPKKTFSVLEMPSGLWKT